ncbi:HlyD family type I secretion periplasmic adaptor subunit [Achromobacter sp. GG226]|uniref:HlyD family type I secretion periplasmic adaptor subunit n=1 Tax=Verticiella alkaliphila TaxID=2779529 RepID=UPI001C0C2D02|nr:HlyD family type I secretion periplasmic adaptor subunit [Verticiella sp. GG226]MBU4612091.1 HlyD family type I secretion periplasmic adaptor subunit [Verticiella sp. GG226]
MAKFFGRKKSEEDVEVLGADVLDAPASAVDIDDRRHTRAGWFIVLFGVFGFLAWAAFAPLDQGVPAPGTVMVSGNRQAVQNLVGGVVDEILVRDGARVKAGDVLIRMNETQSKSEAESLRGQYYSLMAVEARLAAERDGQTQITYPKALLDAQSDPRVTQSIGLQNQLFESRRLALQSELDAGAEGVAALRAQITGLQSIVSSRKDQAGFLKEQLTGMRDLSREGYVPRNRLLELERTWSQLNGDLAEASAGIVQAQRQISEMQQRMTLRRQEYQREVRTQLTDTQREVQTLHSRITYADFALRHADVRAPASGVVVGLSIFTNGGVVQAGTHMMDIVPADEPLMVEVKVPVHLIDKVYPELPVEMMFTAFNQRSTPHIPGKVVTVSADRLVEEKTGEPYYRVEAQVTPEGEKMLTTHDVRPGMPVEVLVKTGERSLLNYLFRPILDRANTALVQE